MPYPVRKLLTYMDYPNSLLFIFLHLISMFYIFAQLLNVTPMSWLVTLIKPAYLTLISVMGIGTVTTEKTNKIVDTPKLNTHILLLLLLGAQQHSIDSVPFLSRNTLNTYSMHSNSKSNWSGSSLPEITGHRIFHVLSNQKQIRLKGIQNWA